MEKQEKIETVQEVAQKQWGNVHRTGVLAFIEGAKWQSEKLFTEDDMRRAYSYGMFAVTTGRNFKDWFINYKSK